MTDSNKNEDYVRLLANGYIKYGTSLPSELLETYFCCGKNEGWKYLAKYLALKETLEENGYLSTSRGCEEGGLRIFALEDMAERSSRLFNRVTKRLRKLDSCLKNTNSSELDGKEFIKYLHMSNKISVSYRAITQPSLRSYA